MISTITDNMWQDIHAVQLEAYGPDFHEPLEILKAKWQASPQSCFVFLEKGRPAAYILSHPWDTPNPPKLFQPLPPTQSCSRLFLHDLAVSPSLNGRGVGKKLVAALLDYARSHGVEEILLVAVQGSSDFWAGFGFEAQANSDKAYIEKSYGQGALAMVLRLD